MKPTGVLLLLASFVLPVSSLRAVTPDWVRAAAGAALPAYPAKTEAVVLFDERVITIQDNGEIRSTRRAVVKILRSEGRRYGTFSASFDNDTRLTSLKAWSLPADQPEYELKEKEAVETGYSSSELYSDVRYKVLRVATEPGSVAAYEYEQRDRPFLLQHLWRFQRAIPVRRSRLVLQLPTGWEFKNGWRNFTAKQPAQAGNQWTWELENVPALESEDLMPSTAALAGQMALTYFSRQPGSAKSHANWRDVGAWYNGLTASRLNVTPEITRQTAALTAKAVTPWDKVQAVAAFVQSQIRYVAIPIGIGSHQPHAAADILANRYGDCKDKATLLKVMLKTQGIESYYVLVNSERGSVDPEFASGLNFNHVVLAIDVAFTGAVFSRVKHPTAGELVVFDPTDPLTPIGLLPAPEQASYGLVVTPEGGDLMLLPAHQPAACRLMRSGSLKLAADGTLAGVVQEVRSGNFATEMRAAYRNSQGMEQAQVLESFLGQSLGQFEVKSGLLENLDNSDHLILKYALTSPGYAKSAGPMLMLRPRVLGRKGMTLGEKKERLHAVELPALSTEIDSFEIELPPGVAVEELPPPVTADYPFARYTSKIELKGSILRYERTYLTRQVEIPKERFDDLWSFQQAIAADERNVVLLRKTQSQ